MRTVWRVVLIGSLASAWVLLVGATETHHSVCRLEGKLVPDDGAAHDRFAYSVAVDGDTVVLGSRMDDDLGENSGSAYVFGRVAGQWVAQAKLLPADGEAHDSVGFSVALEGDTALVGAPGKGPHHGVVYVFARANGIWDERAKLLASDWPFSGHFGFQLAMDRDTAVIGAPANNDNGPASGAVYVFVRAGEEWLEQAKLLPSDGEAGDNFGQAVAVDRDTLVVGAFGDDDNGTYSGSAYVFVREDGAWLEQAKLLPVDGEAGDYFGHWAVAVDGNTAIIGADHDSSNGPFAGAAYVFERRDGVWEERAKLMPADGAFSDSFGSAIALQGDVALIGAHGDAEKGPGGEIGPGSVSLFTRSDGSWQESGKLVAPDGTGSDLFGFAVALSRPSGPPPPDDNSSALHCGPESSTVAIGAWGDDENGPASGSAYVLRLCPEDGGPTAW